MADPQSYLYYTLSNDAGVSGYVEDRIYPNAPPRGVSLPYVVYELLAGNLVRHQTGYSSIRTDHYVITAWARTEYEASNIREAIISALSQSQSGQLGDPADPLDVVWVSVTDYMPETIEYPTGAESPIFGYSVELLIWYNVR